MCKKLQISETIFTHMNNQLLKQVTCFQMYRVKSQFKCEKHNSIIYTIICMHTFLKYSIIGLYFMLCPLQLKTKSVGHNYICLFLCSSCHIGDYICAIIIISFSNFGNDCAVVLFPTMKSQNGIWYIICCPWCSELYVRMIQFGTQYCTDACQALHALLITEREFCHRSLQQISIGLFSYFFFCNWLC